VQCILPVGGLKPGPRNYNGDMVMKRFTFKITITGLSENGNPDEAWDDATEQFSLEPGPTPEPGEYTVEGEPEDDQATRDLQQDTGSAIIEIVEPVEGKDDGKVS